MYYNAPELLSPAGNPQSLHAAIEAGADAVYAGMGKFSARAYAGNFDSDSITEALDFVHLHGKKLYLTANTLIKDKEMGEHLTGALLPFYRQGLDGVLVQDPGLLRVLSYIYPDLPLHASTQMGIMSAWGAELLRDCNIRRIVAARELSLEEIKQLKKAVPEVECFVHGALCYCYSGQCFLSSSVGDRSGNRGRCAQPCRLIYDVNGSKTHLLSPGDMCTLEILPELIRAGIDSLKIEGRMKSPEYVSVVTSVYRHYIDLAVKLLREGKADSYQVDPGDLMKVQQMYMRETSNQGYYHMHNGKAMMSMNSSGHCGIHAGRISFVGKHDITFDTEISLFKGDVLDIALDRHREQSVTLTCPSDYPRGASVRLNASEMRRLKTGMDIYRMKSPALEYSILEDIKASNRNEIRLSAHLTAHAGERLALVLTDSRGISGKAETLNLEKAQKNAPDKERIKRALCQTGGTEYTISVTDLDVDDSVFLPLSRVKEIRRAAIEDYTDTLKRKYSRSDDLVGEFPVSLSCKPDIDESGSPAEESRNEKDSRTDPLPPVVVYICSKDQAAALADSGLNCGVVLSGETMSLERCREIREKYSFNRTYIALPRMFRLDHNGFIEESRETSLNQYDGALVRSYDAFGFILDNTNLPVICGSGLYTYNRAALDALRSIARTRGRRVLGFLAPDELTYREYSSFYGDFVTPVYEKRNVMTSAQCVLKNTTGCTADNERVSWTDRKGKSYTGKCLCRLCTNLIYETEPSCLFYEGVKFSHSMLSFTDESYEETLKVIEAFQGRGKLECRSTGHFKTEIL